MDYNESNKTYKSNESESIIYLPSNNKDSFNQIVAHNQIYIYNRLWNEARINFISLPNLLLDYKFQQLMSYSYPYLSEFDYDDMMVLTQLIKNKYQISDKKSAFVYLSNNDNDGYRIYPEKYHSKTSSEDLDTQIDEIIFKVKFLRKKEEIKVQQDSKLMANDTIASLIPNELISNNKNINYGGNLSLLIEFLEELKQSTFKLSRLRITRKFEIYLMDYEMKEVIMSPLPKALYILFLKYPDGILFKELPDYRNELMDIYKNITLSDNPTDFFESITRMTDPFDNSFNEKCSLIRSAFLNIMSDEIAKNYYITGYSGMPNKIILDRELVVNE